MTYERQNWHPGSQTNLSISDVLSLRAMDDAIASGSVGLEHPVSAFGAVGDGASDDTAAFQAAIDQLPSNGGDVICESLPYVINGTINVIDRDNVRIIGRGAYHGIYSGVLTSGTILKRLSGTGKMVNVETTSSSTEVRKGCAVVGMTIDGQGLASTGLKLTSQYGGNYSDLHIRNCTTAGLDTTTVDLSGLEDTQENRFERITVRVIDGNGGDGIGIRLGSGAGGLGNTSGNDFIGVLIYHKNGVGLQLNDADSNHFFGVVGNWSSGTAACGLELNGSNAVSSGHARSNIFLHAEFAKGVIARATGFSRPSTNNMIVRSTESSPTATVTIESGAGLVYTSLRNFSNQLGLLNTGFLYGRNFADSGDLSLIGTNTSNEVILGANSQGNVVVASGQVLRFGDTPASAIRFGTTNGTKIGDGTNQLMSFWNATPAAQQVLATGSGKTVDNVITFLQSIGLCRQS